MHDFTSFFVNRVTVEPVREHMEQLRWARVVELVEKK